MSIKKQTENNNFISNYIRHVIYSLIYFLRTFRRAAVFPLVLLLLPSIVSAYELSAGGRHTCALGDNGVICWGYDDFGQSSVPELLNPTQISSGDLHTCALDSNGVECWGRNASGQVTVPALSNPIQVSAGDSHTCALDDNGVICWGYNAFGQTNVPALSNPTQVIAGANHTCAIDDSGVVCWGWDAFGQGTLPEQVVNPIQIAAGFGHTCVLDGAGGSDGAGVLCWGQNGLGQSTVPALSNPTQVTVGAYHSCAVDDSGVVCWGQNGYGQTNVPALSNPTQVSAGFGHTCALDDTGVVCWGWNSKGQATVDNSLVFTAVNGSCGESHDKVFSSIPTENLCASGSSSAISGNDPWAWSCSGSYGGSSASCSTKKTEPEPAVNGICGESNDKVFNSIPTEGLCAAGFSSDITGTNPWAWSCAGANGGSSASCSTLARTAQEESQVAFIERFYQNILKRDSDSDGMNFWLNTLQNESGAKVALGFFNSEEFKGLKLDDTAFINILYQTLFGRQPDQGGSDFWMAQLEAGTLRETVIQGFVRSQEFKDLASSFGVVALNDGDNALFQIQSFIERFYGLVLDRKPDIDGFNDWTGQLSNPNGTKSAGDIARGFFQSNEFVGRKTSDSKFIDIAYRAFFDREADNVGKQFWLAELSAGTTRLKVVNGFIVSQEFIDFANRYGIRTD